jgi:tripartite-type tricarboxylate transporter receptor subunit TctC
MQRLQTLLLRVGAAVIAAGALAGTSVAQDGYPNQQIRIVVPFSAGGGNDITARLLGDHMHRLLGQPVIVDNRPGANAQVGTQAVAKAVPDGYTLLVASGEIAVNPHLYKNMAYDWDRDLATITRLVIVPNVLVVNLDVPANNVQELITYAKANPKTTFSSAGVGNPTHLAGELFNKMAGVKLLHVPYKGVAPSLADVVGKQISMTFSSIGAALPFIEAGKLRAIAVTSFKRVSMMPNVPAVAEYPPLAGYELVNFFGFFAPANTPEATVRRLSTTTGQILREPEISARLRGLGFEPAPSTPVQFRELIRSESKKFARIIIDADVKLDTE